ncbi:MAG: hypothetical protein M1828_007251 [Chrysothrix sp. TS-e1954]|nr:MAG: hypothetical protein M1828_007251 [Chrysothrix sp. TS-e1954]
MDVEDVSSPSARIKDLNSIDVEISKVLRSAGQAVSSLTGNTHASQNGATDDDPHEIDAKQAFEAHTKDFMNSVQAIGARLRRQAYALEEAGIIAAEPLTEPQVPQQLKVPGAPAPMQVTNGGLGNLDVGWLNSRGDKVGKQKEAELWAQAREMLGRDASRGSEGYEDSMDVTTSNERDGAKQDA